MRIGGTKYFISSSDTCITLLERYTTKPKGEETKGEYAFKPIGYFTTFEGLLRHLIDLKVKQTQLEDLTTIINEITELKTMLKNIKLEVEEKDKYIFKEDNAFISSLNFIYK